MNIQSILLSLILLLACGCAVAQSPTQSEAKQAIESANELWNKTKTAGHEWATIKPLVAQAKQALVAKDYATAINLAKKASVQSELALIQAEHEKTNWVNNLPK